MMKMLFAGASLALLALAACGPQAATPEVAAAPAAVAETPVPITIAAPAGEYVSDPYHSSITFKLQHLGLSYYTMRLRTFDASVAFDPANIGASKVSATVKPSDIVVGFPGDYVANHPGTKFTSWEDDLANSTNFLDAKQFPQITFVSTSVTPSGVRNATVTGDLTLKGITKPITLDVTFSGETASHAFAKTPAIGFSATGTFKRTDFGLGVLPTAVVGDDVSIQIEGDFIQKPAS